MNQVAWPRPHTWRSQIHLPLSFLQKSLILVHHPRKWCTSMSPPGYEAGEPPPISTKCSLGLPTCNSKPRARTSKWLNTGVSPKGVKPVSMLTVNSCIKFRLDLQADKSPVVVKGPFFPRVVNPRYRIRGTNVWRKSWSSKAK
jgi:hypothetical protein